MKRPGKKNVGGLDRGDIILSVVAVGGGFLVFLFAVTFLFLMGSL